MARTHQDERGNECWGTTTTVVVKKCANDTVLVYQLSCSEAVVFRAFYSEEWGSEERGPGKCARSKENPVHTSAWGLILCALYFRVS